MTHVDTWTLCAEAPGVPAARCRDCAAALRVAHRAAAVLTGRHVSEFRMVQQDGVWRREGDTWPKPPLLATWLRLERIEDAYTQCFDYCIEHGTARRDAALTEGTR